MEGVYNEIKSERDYQNEKWGTDFDDKNTANDWSAYITQYGGKAVAATSPQEWRRQMLKVAALAVAAVEAFDRNGSLPSPHYG